MLLGLGCCLAVCALGALVTAPILLVTGQDKLDEANAADPDNDAHASRADSWLGQRSNMRVALKPPAGVRLSWCHSERPARVEIKPLPPPGRGARAQAPPVSLQHPNKVACVHVFVKYVINFKRKKIHRKTC